METRGKGLLFGLATSLVNAPKGCTWVPKLVSDRLMSVRLCGWIPFENDRRESANFPEDNVTPRGTCYMSCFFLFFFFLL